MKKMMVFTLALVIVLAAFSLSQYDAITDVRANDDKCEDGKTCYWAYHVDKPDQKDRCTHKENNQWKFYVPLRPCGGSDKKDPTDTPFPVIVVQPSNTPANAPTATKQKEVVQPTVTATSQNNAKQPTKTMKSVYAPTSTYVTGENPQQICNWCELAEREADAQETQAAAQSTIAAELSK